MKTTDHLGNEYNSVNEMCQKYNINKNTYIRRISMGMDKEAALTLPVKPSQKTVFDHLNNEYRSVSEMCRKYGIPRQSYEQRKNKGWNIEKILTTPVKTKTAPCSDHLGNHYDSIKEMCEHYNITYKTYINRITNGWSLEETLTISSRKKLLEPNLSMNENVDLSELKFQNGYKIIIHNQKHYIDHEGNIFKNVKSMCEYHNVSTSLFLSRLKKGMSVKEALYKKKVKDHLGNEFESKSKMRKYLNYTNRRNHNE